MISLGIVGGELARLRGVRVLRVAFGVGCAVLLTRCAVVDTVDGRFLQTNLSTEKARNEAILLNIVRASQSAPLNFVGISRVSGSTTATIAGGAPTFLTGPYPIPAATAATGTRDVTISSTTLNAGANASNSYDLTVLDSKDFYTALLSPIDLPTVNFFIRQGYSNELLLWLFVDSVREKWPGQTAIEFRNTPLLPPVSLPGGQQRTYRTAVELAMAFGLTVETRTITVPSTQGAKSKSGANSAGTALRSEVYARVCFDRTLAERNKAEYPEIWQNVVQLKLANARPNPECYTRWDPKATGTSNSGAENDTLTFTITDPGAGTSTWQIFTRSTYGVYQYLGSILALRLADELRLHRVPTHPDELPVLAITDDLLASNCFVEVTYNFARYCVPEARSEHTKRTFALLSQLIALKTQTNDLAITPIVRVTP